MEVYAEAIAKLLAIAAAIAPIVQSTVTVVVWVAARFKRKLHARTKRAIAGLLSVGGAALAAGASGVLPWHDAGWAALFGLGSWYVAHQLSRAENSNAEDDQHGTVEGQVP